MKSLSLVVLMCFSVGLQGFVNPGTGQQYANSAPAIISSAEANLVKIYSQLMAVVGSMEQTLCGISVENGGLNIDSSGSYTNCTGGIMNNYKLWSDQVNYWAPIITEDTKNQNWEDATDACAATYKGNNGYDINFYTDISSKTFTDYSNNMISGISAIAGCSLPAGGSQAGACAEGVTVAMPNKVAAAMSLIGNMQSQMDKLATSIDVA